MAMTVGLVTLWFPISLSTFLLLFKLPLMHQIKCCLDGLAHLLSGIFALQLAVLGFWPLLRLGVEGVPERVVRIVLERHAGRRVPLGVLLGEALLGVGVDLRLRIKKRALQILSQIRKFVKCKNMAWPLTFNSCPLRNLTIRMSS